MVSFWDRVVQGKSTQPGGSYRGHAKSKSEPSLPVTRVRCCRPRADDHNQSPIVIISIVVVLVSVGVVRRQFPLGSALPDALLLHLAITAFVVAYKP